MSADTRIPYLPARVEGLAALAMNLRWSWSRDARALLRAIDGVLSHHTHHKPLQLLRRVDPARIAACASDPAYLRLYDSVMERLRREISTEDTWFTEQYGDLRGRQIAYFCA